MKKRNQQEKILITGGAGFIGSSLILALQNDYRITCLDRGGSLARLKKFTNSNVKLVKGEITDEKLIGRLVKQSDIIIHLAGGGGNSACINNPVWAIKTHLEGTYLLLQKAIKYNIKKFIFTSSCFVYSTDNQGKMPFTEKAVLKPNDFYGNLKLLAEKLIINSGTNYAILRFSNVYGRTPIFPVLSAGAINNFIRKAKEGKDITIFGSGRQQTDYVHITDIVSGIIHVLKTNQKNNIYNMGSGKLISIAGLADIVNEISQDEFNKKIKIKKVTNKNERTHSAPLLSINKAKRELRWQPRVSIEQGIKEMLKI